ncbi:MAG TPA: DNA-directed RNA polymerase subunit omega [Chthoniobacterales bacterium]|jgi:DNA-directed RNA polymerase subunit omega
MNSLLVEEAHKIITNSQVLINVVSKRVRQLSSGARPTVEVGPKMGLSDIALQEIIEGKLRLDLSEPAIV